MKKQIYYDMTELEKNHFWFVARRKIIETVLGRFINLQNSKNLDVLEIGSGTGGNLKYFSEYFPKIKGIEPDKDALKLSKEKIKLEIKSGGLPDDLPYKNQKFDIIFLFDVLEHINKDFKSLAKIKNRLKKGGLLFITIPAFKFLWSQHDTDHQHYRRYTKKDIKTILKKNNYKVLYSSYYNFLLSPLIIGTRFLKKLLRIKSSDTKKPNKFINYLLQKIMSFERYLLKYISLPFGISIITVAKND